MKQSQISSLAFKVFIKENWTQQVVKVVSIMNLKHGLKASQNEVERRIYLCKWGSSRGNNPCGICKLG